MKIFVNGEVRSISDSAVLTQALELAGIHDPRGVAVALNGEVVPASAWASTRLTDGARLEVLRAVQGGRS